MDGDMSDIFQKLNTMLEDKDMSNNLKNILNNFSSSNNQNTSPESSNTTYSTKDQSPNSSNTTHTTANQSPGFSQTQSFNQENASTTTTFYNETNTKANSSSNTTNGKASQGFPEFDINTILKMKSIMDSLNNTENDPRSNLLLSLKPYLADNKKEKIDQYVKFLHFAKVIEILNPMGGDSTKNE